MVRQLLGNIRGPRGERGLQGTQGPQGPKGDKGDTAEITGLTVGTENLLNFSDLYYTYDGAIVNQDYESGRITFTNTGYQLRYDIELDVGKHIVKVDEVKNTGGAYDNYIRFELYNKNNTRIDTYGPIHSNGYIEFEITPELYNVDDGQFNVYIVVGGSQKANGYIDGLRIVKGDIAGSWELSINDTQGYLSAMLRDEVTGVQAEPSEARLSVIETDQTLDGNGVLLSQGVWVIDVNAYMDPIDYTDSYVNITIHVNDSEVRLLQATSSMYKSLNGSHILKINQGDVVKIKAYKQSSGGAVSFGATSSNTVNMYKIGV